MDSWDGADSSEVQEVKDIMNDVYKKLSHQDTDLNTLLNLKKCKPEIADPRIKVKSKSKKVWKYFGHPKIDGDVDDTHVICKRELCYKIFPRLARGSTSNMRAHIKSCHPDIDLSDDLPHQQADSSTCNIEVHEAEDQDTDTELLLNTFLMGKIYDLDTSKTELVGVFGKTGAGKSSLINNIIGEENLLPSGGGTACTSVMIQVQANTTDSNYIAEIEFIPPEEWKDELEHLKKIISANDDSDDSDDSNNTDSSDDDKNKNKKNDDGDDIKEKFKALYKEDFKASVEVKDYMTEKKFRDIGIPEFLKSKMSLKRETSSDLSEEIKPYTRRDSKGGKQYWPLVKCVTIKIPNAGELLQHVALVDLPGTGDRNKSRDEMWKKFVQNCAAVWIVSDKCRPSSEKEPWEILKETIRLIGNGGECQSICFICTKSDHLDSSDVNLSKQRKRDRVLQSNKEVKENLQKDFEEECQSFVKNHFSEDFFHVFAVSSTVFNLPDYMEKEDTEIPKLKRFLEDLSDRHSKTSYVKGAYGILSLMKGAKGTNTQGMDSQADVLCRELETRLQQWIKTVDESMAGCHKAFPEPLGKGVSESVKKCDKVLARTLEDGLHHSQLKSLVQNNGIYKTKGKEFKELNLNEKLSKRMREKIDPTFCKNFPNEARAGPIKKAINKFTLVTKSLCDKHKEVALQMTFLKTEEDKLKTKLVDFIREEKKNIYSCLEESIQESMQPCYDKAAGRHGKGMKLKMQQDLKDHVNASKSDMFEKAKGEMLRRMARLKTTLLKTLQEDMQTSIDQSLKNIQSAESVPDVTKEYEKVAMCHEKLTRAAGGRENETPEKSRVAHKRSRPRTAGHQPCGKKFCSCCPQSANLEEFTNPHTKRIVRLETLTTCETTNVIYAIQCPCPKLYIGKTSTALKDRIRNHKCSIRGEADTLGKHFAQHGHTENDLKFWAIEKVQRGDLIDAEARWINELHTLSPFGLNENRPKA